MGCQIAGETTNAITPRPRISSMAETFIHKNLADRRKEIQAYARAWSTTLKRPAVIAASGQVYCRVLLAVLRSYWSERREARLIVA